jgi:hypothetical protein
VATPERQRLRVDAGGVVGQSAPVSYQPQGRHRWEPLPRRLGDERRRGHRARDDVQHPGMSGELKDPDHSGTQSLDHQTNVRRLTGLERADRHTEPGLVDEAHIGHVHRQGPRPATKGIAQDVPELRPGGEVDLAGGLHDTVVRSRQADHVEMGMIQGH